MFVAAYQAILLPILGEAFSQECRKQTASNKNSSQVINTSKTMATKQTATPESQLRHSAAACLAFWCQQDIDKSGNTKKSSQWAIHKACSVMSLLGGHAISEQGLIFRLPQTMKGVPTTSLPTIVHDSIMSIKTLQNIAAIHVQVQPPSSSPSLGVIHGWLTMLQSRYDNNYDGWVCIAAAFSDKNNTVAPILPQHFHDVTQLVWDGYCGANRACDGTAMAQVFHPTCRLTYVKDSAPKTTATATTTPGTAQISEENKNHEKRNSATYSDTSHQSAPVFASSADDNSDNNDDDIVVCPQPAFCDKVEHRYREPMHLPYAKLQRHPDVGRYDTLQAIDFVTPDLCMVTLVVAHPPCVWTALLTCCNLNSSSANNTNDIGSSSSWWIVHKSSCHDNYELTDDMKAVLLEDLLENCEES